MSLFGHEGTGLDPLAEDLLGDVGVGRTGDEDHRAAGQGNKRSQAELAGGAGHDIIGAGRAGRPAGGETMFRCSVHTSDGREERCSTWCRNVLWKHKVF
jgi:hypothetical protein